MEPPRRIRFWQKNSASPPPTWSARFTKCSSDKPSRCEALMAENPLRQLNHLGQSVWYDYIRRGEILSGHLKRLIDEDGLSGITSNPSIFEKAIAGSKDYD